MRTSWPLLLILIWGVTSLSAETPSMDTEPELWCTYTGESGPGRGKRIVLIAGDDEYRSEEALPMLAKMLAKHHGFTCTVLFPINEKGRIQPDYQTNIPGMHLLNQADILLLGLRFRNLPDSDMEILDQYLRSGKPILAIRTSTHAFNIPRDRKFARYSYNSTVEGWEGGFGRRVLGDTWIRHHGRHGKQSTRGIVNPEFRNHPVLAGVNDIWGPTDVYAIEHLPPSAKVLLHGQVVDGMTPQAGPVAGSKNDPMMPLAWVRSYPVDSGTKAKIFCTTMGAATDFQSADLRRLIVNAVYWCGGMEEAIRPESSVAFVGDYQPTDFGFGNYRQDLKPMHYR